MTVSQTPSADPPDAPSASVDDELGRHVADEQLRMVFSHMLPGTLVATAFALLLAVHLADRVSHLALGVWVALKLGIALPRLLHARWYQLRVQSRGLPATAAWQRSTTWLLALDGACWGLGGAWLMAGPTELVAEVAACLCCVASVATFGLQVRWTATAAYVVPMITPMALALGVRADPFGLFAGIGLALFLGLLLATARRSEQRLAEVFRLRWSTDRISAERAQALELAHRQSQVKSQFLAAMSHELRTPLHGILGLARVIRSHHEDPSLRHHLGLIEHSGEHLLQLINDLLDMSRIEAGRVEVHDRDFDLAAELDDLIDIHAVRAHEKQLELLAHIRLDAPCWVRGDPTRVRQVMHNLLGNALKFTERGRVELRVTRTGTGPVQFSVEDTGPGIPAEELARVFDAFWQSSTNARHAVGTGLGLNIALEMTRAMGGDLRCRSQVGLGSTFLLSLPLPAVAPPVSAANESAWMVGDIGGPPRRVLLAEDNEVNALVVQAMLAKLGCEVTTVDNGDDAVQVATQVGRRPDIVLMDCQMPLVDGLEATRRIRERERVDALAHITVVALTANTSIEDRLACQDAGMDHFLGKPFTERDLFKVLSASWDSA